MKTFEEFISESEPSQSKLDDAIKVYKQFRGPGHNLFHPIAVIKTAKATGIDKKVLQSELARRSSLKRKNKAAQSDWYLDWENENQ